VAGKAKKGKAFDIDAIEKLDLDSLLGSVEHYSVGGVKTASDIADIQRIPIGYSSVDKFLGGGFPRGRITEISGQEGSGKTLLAMAAVAGTQKLGDLAVWIDAENTFDPQWAEINGVDINKMIIVVPESGDKGYELVKQFVASNKFGVVVVDSVAGMIPEAELLGEVGDANIGLHARLNGSAMKHLGAIMPHRPRTALLLINQFRSNIGQMGHGPQNVTTGGKAIPFYCTVRLWLRRQYIINSSGDTTGVDIEVSTKKAKITGMKDRSKATFRVDFDYGIDFAQDVLDILLVSGALRKAGAWFTYEGTDPFKVQGEYAVKQLIRQNLDGWRSQLASS
jgi:recombination protein RecA